MDYTKENLNNLSLVELKLLCKELNISRTGTKKQLIKLIIDIVKPEPEVISIPKDYKPPKGKKIVTIKLSERDKQIQLGKFREKENVKNLYYSMGVYYYLVDEEFNFL